MGRMESSKAGRVIIVKNTQRLFQEFLDRLKNDAGHLFLHVLLRSILIHLNFVQSSGKMPGQDLQSE
jgi:hypothetical protein